MVSNDNNALLKLTRWLPGSGSAAQPGRQGWRISPRDDSMPHVALLIETAGSYGRGLLQGIAKYNRACGGWSIYSAPRGLTEPPPAWLRHWRGDGMLIRTAASEMADAALRSGAAVVNLRAVGPAWPFPSVTVDNAQIAELALRHLQERGLVHFAFCGRPQGDNPAPCQRGQHFRRSIGRAGGIPRTFPAVKPARPADWEEEQSRLAQWIQSLPKPVGVMACDDERGLQVLDACRRCGAAVPDEVAVIGVDNDETLCNLSIPPLTSIDVNAEGIGYEAAALLDRMMRGGRPPSRPVKIAPRGVVTRRSTDVVACEDEEVRRTVRYIRERACGSLQVVDVLAHVGMSRASLQPRMKQIVGRTIHQEIQRVRVARAKQLLVNSDLTIKQVARESGFASVQYMTRVFRRATGETPARYRRHRTI